MVRIRTDLPDTSSRREEAPQWRVPLGSYPDRQCRHPSSAGKSPSRCSSSLREPDRRRRDEERLSRSEQRTLSKTQNNHLTGKAPYKFESFSLQRGDRKSV